MNLFTILPVGTPPIELLKRLALTLSATLEGEVRLADKSLDPAFAALPDRGQVHSTPILARIDKMYDEYRGRVLGVTTKDLCIPILTFVFGEAQLRGRAAVVSTCRLKQEFYGLPANEELFFERLVKESMHELGHTFGLKHCPDWQCVMHPSNGVEEIDIKGAEFCPTCRHAVF